MSAPPTSTFDSTTEQGVLRLSIAASFGVAAIAVAFGLFANSSLIIFDGIYGLIDVVMTWLSLLVVRLISLSTNVDALQSRLNQRFTMGFWHLEPIVLGVSGTLMIGAALYAAVNAVDALMSGGREIALGPAIVFAVISIIVESGLALFVRRANRTIGSEFIALDAKNWMVAASMSAAYLVAFGGGWLLRGTEWAWLVPYIDPAILLVVCLFVVVAPLGTVRQALSDILLITPVELQAHVDDVARGIVAKYGFIEHRSYVAKVGRGDQIELFFVVPANDPPRRLVEWDQLRDEIGEALGEESTDRWLTIMFTTDREWTI
ncbi:cation transporter [Stenotrophomonas sp. ISL-67]|uniref:cation diffusion facilitator family transporter n=1 Tax=Stenotrophomonas sp. ISL-67 TaxID=2819171 RepID=UPI001BE8F072|nr:cation transporter [Stenotrophomonas sp. ISL-67]MBT2767636.1 cation transporter [Stenotrophomonas sp. ISL-67]